MTHCIYSHVGDDGVLLCDLHSDFEKGIISYCDSNCAERNPNCAERKQSMKVELTKAEAESLALHLEIYLLREVRDDPDYDNLDYLLNLVHIYERCKTAAYEKGASGND